MRLSAVWALYIALTLPALPGVRAQGRPRGPASLVQRADSIAALDAATEVQKAIRKADLRFVAVCGYVCFPPGVDLSDSTVLRAARTRAFHYIEGTSDAIMNDAVARLNGVAATYAERYNRLLARHLHVREAPQPGPLDKP